MNTDGQTSPVVPYLREFAFICGWLAVFDTVREVRTRLEFRPTEEWAL